MIRSLTLKNFQGHQQSSLEFAPGINVISGQSDAGKSSIIRALWWILKNRPSGGGETFKFTGIGRGEEVAATVVLDEGEVTRFFKGGKNGYRIGDPELVAIKTDVPQEVLSVLDMDDHNIQPQHQPYFLLADGPAEVARKLNAICGLDIIDACLKNASLLVSRNTMDIKSVQERIEFGKKDLERFGDLIDREASLLVLDEKEQHLSQTQEDHDRLSSLISACEESTTHLQELREFLKVESKAQILMQKQEKLQALQGSIEALEQTLRDIGTLESSIPNKKQAIQEAEARFHQHLEELGQCPLCGKET